MPTLTRYSRITDFPGYRVGTDGSVWSRWVRSKGKNVKTIMGYFWKKLTPTPTGEGKHLTVSLVRKGVKTNLFVHHLVLEAFVGPRPPGMEGCHFPDVDVANNRLENLRWDTHAENMKDTIRAGTVRAGVNHHQSRFTQEEVLEIRREYASGEANQPQLAKKHNTTQQAISDVVRMKTYKK